MERKMERVHFEYCSSSSLTCDGWTWFLRGKTVGYESLSSFHMCTCCAVLVRRCVSLCAGSVLEIFDC